MNYDIKQLIDITGLSYHNLKVLFNGEDYTKMSIEDVNRVIAKHKYDLLKNKKENNYEEIEQPIFDTL